MINIYSYILLSKEERQKHLKLIEPCVNRGGGNNWVSVYSKGLLAHILDTTIPVGHKIHACHACNNGICSNPYHLYWGTPSENRQDAIACGAVKPIWDCMVAKYGLQKAREIQSTRKDPTAGGRAGKGKAISFEQRKKISDSIKFLHKQGVYDQDRKEKNAAVVERQTHLA